MIVKEIYAKTILSKSKVSDYTINPYVGCEHSCTYCYARFMKKFTGHKEAWGEFVDVKVNASSLLESEVQKKRVGRVWISGICDPYQPIEKKYELTRDCIRILLDHNWPATIQTKSPLVLRDMDLLSKSKKIEAGFTIATADDEIRRIFEPNAPSVEKRIMALEKLHSSDIKTYAMVAPMLPKAQALAEQLKGKVDYVLIDRMNYHYADWVYKEHSLEYALTPEFFTQNKMMLAEALEERGIPYQILF